MTDEPITNWRDEDPITWIGKDFNFSMAPNEIIYHVMGIRNYSNVEFVWFVDDKAMRGSATIKKFKQGFELCPIDRPINSSL